MPGPVNRKALRGADNFWQHSYSKANYDSIVINVARGIIQSVDDSNVQHQRRRSPRLRLQDIDLFKPLEYNGKVLAVEYWNIGHKHIDSVLGEHQDNLFRKPGSATNSVGQLPNRKGDEDRPPQDAGIENPVKREDDARTLHRSNQAPSNRVISVPRQYCGRLEPQSNPGSQPAISYNIQGKKSLIHERELKLQHEIDDGRQEPGMAAVTGLERSFPKQLQNRAKSNANVSRSIKSPTTPENHAQDPSGQPTATMVPSVPYRNEPSVTSTEVRAPDPVASQGTAQSTATKRRLDDGRETTNRKRAKIMLGFEALDIRAQRLELQRQLLELEEQEQAEGS
ncbi:hypothetical protein Slin15195_G031870 [Septoria linicola]|uniref:Uncharacterized protein n=1 Tax=Septoria linicola TaxID=215465 RepID=A0A9Q9AMV7_9PEZI|nr:hypothetical protein Slin14017_G030890 [Septoria linicola]USW49868.1 hypothetical protein Slin15195_G031870 [Septoria linicola]